MVKINKFHKIAIAITDLMKDNTITLADWKYNIPFYMTQNPDHILIISNNLAEGIQYQQARYGFDMPAEFVVAHPQDPMIVLDGKEYREQ